MAVAMEGKAAAMAVVALRIMARMVAMERSMAATTVVALSWWKGSWKGSSEAAVAMAILLMALVAW